MWLLVAPGHPITVFLLNDIALGEVKVPPFLFYIVSEFITKSSVTGLNE